MNKAHGIFLTKGFGMNDLVEDKFVAWINSQVGYNYFDCFLAGRESMREDAIKFVDGEHLFDNTGEDSDYAYDKAIDHALEAIKEIS
jgi:hypothetical protein